MRRQSQNLMGWMPPPDGIEVCHAGDVALPATEEKASMEKATIIGIDLAKRVFRSRLPRCQFGMREQPSTGRRTHVAWHPVRVRDRL